MADKTGVPSALLKRRIRLGLKPVPRTPARRGVNYVGKEKEIVRSELHRTSDKVKQTAQNTKKQEERRQNKKKGRCSRERAKI